MIHGCFVLHDICKLIADKGLDCVAWKAHVGTEFPDGNELMIGFVEMDSDLKEETTAVALTFARDALNVFRVNADSGELRFHRLSN